MSAFDFTDFYTLYKGHPRYEPNELIEDEPIDVIIQKYEMILFTNKGEVIGEPDLGCNLYELLYSTKVSDSYVRNIINTQIAKYIPELLETNYNLNVVFVQDPENYQDIMFINLKVADYDIYAQIGKFR
jgi:phage baseplate assembly protein W